ncbi:MFS transporter [Aestuariimicrobium sp. T2.26MG-19.2B]|uniref:MFS transporter n=1 Tax=Aestuariimicrobium sp. T2.26MG-19.2B TaxID=3040679 RepID=UPI0024773C16|nr:nitrate/nitrite transporter [Aestuariimicrobium sp. T2.26MG-19.2B]CAI9402213.1 Nitrate/nitrite transporter NarK [Aestuariimicrobium sp. T2.26MG-19.2B]
MTTQDVTTSPPRAHSSTEADASTEAAGSAGTLSGEIAPESPSRLATGRWIEHWDPENPTFWASHGKAVARRNLIFSIVAEHIGFSVWMLWSIVVVTMYGTYDSAGTLVEPGVNGWALTAGQGLTLLAVASGVGAVLRVPYTFMVPIFGGRNWTVVSALLLLVPTLGLSWAVSHPETSFGVLVAIAATAGLGGGNFASSMANISFFYPDRQKGWALGLNAAGGNIGVAVAQKVVPFVVGLGGVGLAAAGLVYAPLAIAAAVCAFLLMDNLREAKADPAPTLRAVRHSHVWLMALLYIGTFGSFIGYSAAFPTLLTVVFRRPDLALGWGFAGALVGSLARPFGGRLADRFGGSIITLTSFVLMAAAGCIAVAGVRTHSIGLFFASFVALFAVTGVGNGSTYRMIPAIFGRLRALDPDTSSEVSLEFKRQSAGAVGIISAVGALGGFAIPFVYKWSRESFGGSIVPALQVYVGVFLVLAAITWLFFLRRGTLMRKV